MEKKRNLSFQPKGSTDWRWYQLHISNFIDDPACKPTPLLNHRSPYSILHGAPPAYSSLRAFGCLCYVHISKSIRHKFEPKADCCIFLGYSDDHKGFRCFSLCRRRVFISRHVTFEEATLYDPPSTVPQSQREVPHMLPTVTDSASEAPEITILPIPTAGASWYASTDASYDVEGSSDLYRA